MEVLIIVLYTIVVIVALMLTALILVQQSKGGGFGSAFGGAGESVFGAQAGNQLTKLTVILTTAFFALVLLLAILIGHRDRTQSSVDADLDAAETVKPVPTAEKKPSKLDVKIGKTAIDEIKSVKEKKTGAEKVPGLQPESSLVSPPVKDPVPAKK